MTYNMPGFRVTLPGQITHNIRLMVNVRVNPKTHKRMYGHSNNTFPTGSIVMNITIYLM